MKVSFEVQNLKCGGCANTITKKLSEEFGDVSVDVEKKIVAFELGEEKSEENAKEILRGLGYPVVGDTKGFFSDNAAKAKSFVSCAVGKFDK